MWNCVDFANLCKRLLLSMAVPFVEFRREGYIIRKFFVMSWANWSSENGTGFLDLPTYLLWPQTSLFLKLTTQWVMGLKIEKNISFIHWMWVLIKEWINNFSLSKAKDRKALSSKVRSNLHVKNVDLQWLQKNVPALEVWSNPNQRSTLWTVGICWVSRRWRTPGM